MRQKAIWLGVWAGALIFVGACYSALDPAGDSSSQYADNPNGPDGNALVPLPAQIWEGLNLMPHNASSLCVDGVASGGAQVSLQSCSGSVLQRFKWQEGALELAGGRCLALDESQGPAKVGTPLQLASCDANSTAQLWAYGNGWIYPEVAGRTTPPSLCLSTVSGNTDLGVTFALAACTATPAPVAWDLGLYDGNSFMGFAISSGAAAGFCMANPNTAATNNSPVITSVCTDAAAMRFRMQQGLLRVNNACLRAATAPGAANPALVVSSVVAGDANEVFALEHGRIRPFAGPNAARCVEVPGANPAAQKPLDLSDCTTAPTLVAGPQMHWILGSISP